jgi:hypothetical protein
MRTPPPFLRRAAFLVLGCTLAVLPAGCQEEEGITRRVVPTPKAVPQEVKAEANLKVRLLAAIVPDRNDSWFFKLLGPVGTVGEKQKAFEDFLQTVRLTNDANKPITWTLPAGWKQEPGNQFRYATLRLGPDEAAPEVSVSRASGSLLDNVNRWRRLDLDLPPLLPAQLDQVTRKVKVNDAEATLVDMSGPGTGKAGMGLRLKGGH